VPVDPDCVAALESAAKLCEELGHEVTEGAPAVSGDMLTQAFLVLWTAGASATIDASAMLLGRAATKDDVEPLSWALAEAGRAHSAGTYLMAIGGLQFAARQVALFMERFDVLLTPTLALPPLPLGSFDAPEGQPLMPLIHAGAFAPFTALQNVTGQPAMNVPLHWNGNGLPIGVQFIGRYGDEATLFRLAAQLEAARPWGDKRPGISA
jgi:amidase